MGFTALGEDRHKQTRFSILPRWQFVMPPGWRKLSPHAFTNCRLIVRYKPELGFYWRIEDLRGNRLANRMTASQAMADAHQYDPAAAQSQ